MRVYLPDGAISYSRECYLRWNKKHNTWEYYHDAYPATFDGREVQYNAKGEAYVDMEIATDAKSAPKAYIDMTDAELIEEAIDLQRCYDSGQYGADDLLNYGAAWRMVNLREIPERMGEKWDALMAEHGIGKGCDE